MGMVTWQTTDENRDETDEAYWDVPTEIDLPSEETADSDNLEISLVRHEGNGIQAPDPNLVRILNYIDELSVKIYSESYSTYLDISSIEKERLQAEFDIYSMMQETTGRTPDWATILRALHNKRIQAFRDTENGLRRYSSGHIDELIYRVQSYLQGELEY